MSRITWERARRIFFPVTRAKLLSALVILSASVSFWSFCFPAFFYTLDFMTKQIFASPRTCQLLFKSVYRLTIPSGIKPSPLLLHFHMQQHLTASCCNLQLLLLSPWFSLLSPLAVLSHLYLFTQHKFLFLFYSHYNQIPPKPGVSLDTDC